MKKFIGSFLTAALLVSPFTQTAFAADSEEEIADPYYKYFAEDIDGHWAEDDMKNMLQAEVIKGVRDVDDYLYLQPNALITRAQFTVLVVRALELKTDQQGKTFTDVGSHWAKEEINIASALGIITGKTETEFKPNMNITRAEIATIVARAFDPTVTFENGTPKNFSDLSTDHWAYDNIRKASGVDILRGTTATTVSPNSNAKRAEATVMLKRALWLEDVDLLSPDAAMDLIYNSEVDKIDAINEKDTDSMFLINDSSRFGLGHEYEKMDAEIFVDYFAAGGDAVVELVSEPVMEVVHQSTRFVEVDVEDLFIDYSEPGEVEEEPYTEDRSGTYYLIKRNGEWKIYTSDFYNDYLNFDF
jgi:hypothetical protein